MHTNPNTVYISYVPSRSLYITQPLFNGLDKLGYDVFMDIDEGIDPVSLRQVGAREHFIMVLTPGSLEKAGSPHDRLTLDFQEAVRHKRNMILLLTKDFYFDKELHATKGVITHLPRIKGLRISPNHLKSVINILDQDFLTKSANAPSTLTPIEDAVTLERKLNAAHEYARQATIRLNTEKLLFRAVTKIRRGQYEDALKDLDVVISNNPKNENAYLQRAMLQQKMGRNTAALRDYERAVQLSPKMVDAHTGLGQLLLLTGRSQQALQSFQMGLRVKQDSTAALAGVAVANHSLGNHNEASRVWHELLKQDENFANPTWAQKQLNWNEDLMQRVVSLVERL